MTIVAVIYGYTPKATIENVCKDPPEKNIQQAEQLSKIIAPASREELQQILLFRSS